MKPTTKSEIEKLNFKKYPTKLILNKPDDVMDLDTVDYDESIAQEQYNLIFAFIFNMDEFLKDN